jgi:pyroglutamyl-peptidase
MDFPSRPRQIHVTAAMIPTVYDQVLALIPGFHARPPVIPLQDDIVSLPPPEDG